MKQDKVNIKGWRDITLREFDEITEISRSGIDDTSLTIKLLAALSDRDEDYFWNLPLNEIGQYSTKLSFLKEYKIRDNYKVDKVRIGGMKYMITDLSKMTTAQFFDFQNLSKNSKDDTQQMRVLSKLLSIFIIPEGHTYNDGYDISELQQKIYNEFSFDEAQSIMGFRLAKYLKLLLPSQRYLAHLRTRMTPTQREEMTRKLDQAIEATTSLLVS